MSSRRRQNQLPDLGKIDLTGTLPLWVVCSGGLGDIAYCLPPTSFKHVAIAAT